MPESTGIINSTLLELETERRRETERMSETGKVVCVTGAAGYIASWIVKLLLQRGYTVKATVRDTNNPEKTKHLLALDGAKERLHLFKANLLEEGSFDSIVDGCEGVFHTASPVFLSVADPQAQLIDPAVKGTLNVLKSCSKFPSIKKVVITSSMASVIVSGRPLTPDVVVDETWFSDPDYCEKIKSWYALSKTLAEKVVWNFAKENGIDLVTMNPGFVIGPFLQPTLNLTTEMTLKLVNGAQTFPNANFRYVDVRDVSHAHILAYENQSASGRYCLVGRVVHCSEALNPALHLPDKCEDEKPFESKYEVSKEKAKGLGVDFIPFEISLKDTIECLMEKNFLKF